MINLINRSSKLYRTLKKNIIKLLYHSNTSDILHLKQLYNENKRNKKYINYIINHEIIPVVWSTQRFTVCRGCPVIFLAVMKKSLTAVQFLVERCNANVEAKCHSVHIFGVDEIFHVTPLFLAVLINHLPVVKYLKCKGANINVTADKYINFCHTPLMFACHTGNLKNVKYLVENIKVDNVVVNISNRYGETCLMEACKMSHFDVAKYLLLNVSGVNTHDENIDGFTTLYFCCVNGAFNKRRHRRRRHSHIFINNKKNNNDDDDDDDDDDDNDDEIK